MNTTQYNVVILAGWTTRSFSENELITYLCKNRPPIFEISKDLLKGEIPIKTLRRIVEMAITECASDIAFAGTTDFVYCSGFSFDTYLDYLKIQAAQAAFLNARYFRITIGKGKAEQQQILERVVRFAELISPIVVAIEIHHGWESNLENLRLILEETNAQLVIDFQNLIDSGLERKDIEDLPGNRFSYFHSRNLVGLYEEHEASVKEEFDWVSSYEDITVLWEPKKATKSEVVDIVYGL